MELRRHSVEFGFLQGIIFCNGAKLCEQGLTINGKLYAYPQFNQTVEVREGWFTQTLVWGDTRFSFFRFIDSKPLFKYALKNHLLQSKAALQVSYDELLVDIARFDSRFGLHKRYLRDSDKSLLQNEFQDSLSAFSCAEHFTQLGFDTSAFNCRLAKFIKQPEAFTEKYNQWWQEKQLDAHQPLFDSLEANPLTLLQRQACVTDENNTLVIAGAGTGKTSTMAAKAAYLVNQGLAKPEEILMLAYGRDARVELEQRLTSIAGNASQGAEALAGVKVSTFHALGKEIIQYYLNRSTQVSVLASDDKRLTQFVDQQIDAIVADPQMADPVADYFGRYLYPQVNELDFNTQGQYRSYLKNNEIRALSGDRVKSFQELTICNYLYTHGIEFDYEPRYRSKLDSKDDSKNSNEITEPGKSVYQPDFYIPLLDAYLEHFGQDKQGNTRPDIDKEAYQQSREWKIALHKRHNTCLLQTFSWQAEKDGLEKSLEALLCERCAQLGLEESQLFKPISPQEVFAQVKHLGVYRNVSRLMSSFLGLFKSSGYTLAGLEAVKMAKGKGTKTSTYNQLRWKAFLHLFRWVYSRYDKQLKSLNTLDFSDMIAEALKITRAKDFHQKTADRFRYKYIMVDEFQDISAERAKLVTELRDSSPGCALFCVGDDWQAIYRFTGSNLGLTTQFSETFGATKTVMLDKTFRFNDKIEKVASQFVQANPAQLKKRLTTHSCSDNPQVCLMINNRETAITQAFDSIDEVTRHIKAAKRATVMLIGRFNASLKELSHWQRRYPQFAISGFSAHASKGKQADYVIVLDVNNDKYGFPCKIDSDPILEALLPKLDSYADTEERRLFYVALSRAKQTVFVQAELGKESVFVKELRGFKGDIRVYLSDLAPMYHEQLSCPECNEGKLIPREGRYGLFYTCSLGQDYCDTKLEACGVCQSAPMLRNETHHFCSSAKCGHKSPVCPKCISGKLVQRTNSHTGKAFLACSLHKKAGAESCQYTCNVPDKIQSSAA
ncbi:UvrD-helicase domain-containing protein [uncultured Shewanella sp.]|uniref:UvrD-helicase domain-containing protein n=1 Tax=uncultured Shewanella sp. TaxID=173975 RepID=UPI00262A7287|nr:UvrD-helicase domain-containing protein [uncultured Shewanella sp.]